MTSYLSSWNEGLTKEKILDFVSAVTDPERETFVPVPDRIAAFDNDGCCWIEKPAYIQLYFSIARLKMMATHGPGLREKPHFLAALKGDMDYFARLDPHVGGDIKQLMQVIFAMVREYMTSAKHPRFGRPFIQMIYQPMVELIKFLHAHDFKVFL